MQRRALIQFTFYGAPSGGREGGGQEWAVGCGDGERPLSVGDNIPEVPLRNLMKGWTPLLLQRSMASSPQGPAPPWLRWGGWDPSLVQAACLLVGFQWMSTENRIQPPLGLHGPPASCTVSRPNPQAPHRLA